MKSVTLYTRPECGLCSKVQDLLTRLQGEGEFSLEIVDIEKDTEAHDRYWLRIPVVLVDGYEVASAPIGERELRAALAFEPPPSV